MIKQENFLRKYIVRLRVLYGGILVVIVFIIIILLMRIQDIESFIDLSLTTRAEGSLSENNSFINTLITEVTKKRTQEDFAEERKKKEKIKKLLEKIQQKIYANVRPANESQNTGKNLKAINLDALTSEQAQSLLHPDITKQLSITTLNLVSESQEIIDDTTKKPLMKIQFLRNSTDKTNPRSFLYIPARMVIKKSDSLDVPEKLKKEIIFSKCIEKYLLELLNTETSVQQVYFISINGFLRICAKDAYNQVKHFKDNFSYNLSFDDRPYMHPTLEENFSSTSPYVDIAGMGVVITYTVRIIHKGLKIIGIIGVDHPLVPRNKLKKLLQELSLGSWTPFFKRFWLEFCPDISQPGLAKLKQLKKEEKNEIYNYYEKYKDQLFAGIRRFPLKDKEIDGKRPDRIIFTIPIDKKELAIIIFDSIKLKRNNWILLLVFLAIAAVIASGIIYTYFQGIKKIEQSRRSLDIISHMGHSYIITDKNHKIIEHNDEFIRLVEKEHDYIERKKFLDFLTGASVTDYKYLLQSNKERFECTVNVKGVDKDKPAILINTKTDYPLVSNPRLSILIESENFESMVAQKYIGRISHILKTPLHSILMIADMLRRKSARKRFNEYFSILDSEINDLSSSLTKWLSISRVEYKHLRPEFESFDLTRLMKNIAQEFAAKLAKQKNIRFESLLNPGIFLVGDKDLIKVAVENILDNAIKYTPDGFIAFRLYEETNHAKIVIKDSGIGIAPKDIDKIFEQGFRCDHKVVKQREGQGIGLYQGKQYIKLCGGDIFVKSVKESGTTFTVILPQNPISR